MPRLVSLLGWSVDWLKRGCRSPGPAVLSEAQVKPWLLPSVYERLKSGQGEYLAEIRLAVALFMCFGGIDYDADTQAGQKLDSYIQ